MTHIQETTISVRVDSSNPGQFFACCGLLELANRLWDGAEGWFDQGEYLISTQAAEASLSKILTMAHDLRISGSNAQSANGEGSEDEGENASDEKAMPIAIVSPILLVLDWWKDKSLKTWAGSMDPRKIFLAMCNAIDTQNNDPFNQSQVVFDPQSERKEKPKKREPFYFDGSRGDSARPIDVGFSTDSLMNTFAHPAVEALCLVGLQRCQPRSTRTPRVFDYFTWHIPVPVSVVPAAVSGLIGNGDCYRFENAFRTDQRKHKAFMPATRIPRSSQ
jgi:CRISPR-associated protein Csb3